MFSVELTAVCSGILFSVFAFGMLKSEHDALKNRLDKLEQKHFALEDKIFDKLTTISVDLAEIKGRLAIQKEE